MSKQSNVVILVTGSRSISDKAAIHKELNEFLKTMIINGYDDFYLLHGDAEGVDVICGEWAINHNVTCIDYAISNTDWSIYGKSAGIIRNLKMLNEAIDICREKNAKLKPIAFWDGSSPGTKHMIDSIKKAGYNVSLHLMGRPKTKRLF